MTNVRYRCRACGNLTRFDVTTTRTAKAFYHYSVGGELTIEDQEVVSESVDKISCRWCGRGDSVEVMEADGGVEVDTASAPPTES